jgi:hypothetical protein
VHHTVIDHHALARLGLVSSRRVLVWLVMASTFLASLHADVCGMVVRAG